MIIDSHQHFWIYNAERDTWITPEMQVIRQDFLPKDLRPVLKANGVDGCVAVQAAQNEAETDLLLQLAEANDFVKGVVGWIDLRADNVYDRLEFYSQFEKLKGFRHVVQAEPPGFLREPQFIRGVNQLQAFDFTYDILIYPDQLQDAIYFASELPDINMVVDHLAKPYIKARDIDTWKRDITRLARVPNVSCKVSGMVTEADWVNWKYEDFVPYLTVIAEAFGPDRMLFGSDWPVCLVASAYDRMKSIVETFIAENFPDSHAAIMGENAVRFYNLDR